MRHKNTNWNLGQNSDGTVPTQHVQWALLMDLRDELRRLNNRFDSLPCIPGILRSIERQLKLQRRCPVHPRYTGRQKPRTDCHFCARLHRARWK